MKSNREGFDFDNNGEINESKKALGLNKKVQKKFSSKREEAVEDVGKVVWYNAPDFADAIRDKLDNDEIAKHFELIVAEEAPKSANESHKIKIFVTITTRFYMPLGTVFFDYKKEKPMFYVVYSLGNISSFEGKKTIETVKYKFSGREFNKYEANSEELDLLVKDIDRVLREKFPENDLFIGGKSKAIDESASLGLNKHVQKKFEHGAGEDAIDGLNEVDDDTFAKMCIEEFSNSPYIDHAEDKSKDGFRWVILKTRPEYAVDVTEGKSGLPRNILIKIFTEEQKLYFRVTAFMYVFNNDGFVTSIENEGPEWREFSHNSIASVAELKRAREELDKFFKKFTDIMSSISESSLGLNKHVQKKFNDIDAVDNVSEYVDLGLPSGTLWCKHNYGALSEEEHGSMYSFSNARELGICLPSVKDFMELETHCTSSWTESNGVNGYMFTSRVNGESVFFPASGRGKMDNTDIEGRGKVGRYWTSTVDHTHIRKLIRGFAFHFGNTFFVSVDDERVGLSVKAVVKPVREASLGLNKRVQKKHSEKDVNDAASEIGSVPLDVHSFEEFAIKYLDGAKIDYDRTIKYRATFEDEQALKSAYPSGDVPLLDFSRKSRYVKVDRICFDIFDSDGEELTSSLNIYVDKEDNIFDLECLSLPGTEFTFKFFSMRSELSPRALEERIGSHLVRNVSESSLGLNKHVQKKFEDTDKVENLETELPLDVFKDLCVNAFSKVSGIKDVSSDEKLLRFMFIHAKDHLKSEHRCTSKNGSNLGVGTIYILIDKDVFRAWFQRKYVEGKEVISKIIYFGLGERPWSVDLINSPACWFKMTEKNILSAASWLDQWMKKIFSEEDLNESMKGLGLNKHVQKKFEEKDAIDNISDYVDLGLPSGTLWCKHNYGTEKEYESGEYYSFEEAQSLGISLPTKEDFIELHKNCTHELTTVDGVHGMMFTSKSNGESVFFPAAGYKLFKFVSCRGSEGRYWSSEDGVCSPDGYGMVFDSYTQVNPSGTYLKTNAYSLREVQKPMRESSLGLNKHVQKKFNDRNPEGTAEEIGNLVYMSAKDFFEGLQRQIDKDPVCRAFKLKVRGIERKSDYQVNAILNNDEYEEIASIKVLEKSAIADNPLFLLTFNGKYPGRFEGKVPIWSTLRTTTWWNTNAEEIEALVEFLKEKIKKNFPSKVNETSLGLNKHIQKKFQDIDDIENLELDYVDLGLPSGTLWCMHNYGATSEEEIGERHVFDEAQKLGVDVPSKKDFIELYDNCDHKSEYVNGIYGIRFISKKNEKSIFFPAPGLDFARIERYWSSTQFTFNSGYNMSIDFGLMNPTNYNSKFFKYPVRPVKRVIKESSLGLNKHVQKKFEDKKPEDMTEEIDVMSIDEFETKFIEEINSLVISQAPLVKFHAVKRELDTIVIETTYPGKLSSTSPDNDSNGQLEFYVDEDDGSIVFSFWCCNSLSIKDGYKSEWFGRKKNKGNFYHKMCYKNLFKAISFARDFFIRHHNELYSDIDESSLGLNKHVQKRYEERDPVDTEGLDIMKDPSAFMFAIQRYVHKKYSDVFTKFNLNDNIVKFRGELVDAKILTMYDYRFDPYSRFSPHVKMVIDKKNLKFAVYVATEDRGILYDDGSEWHDLSLSIMRESLEWAVRVFTGEIHESSLGLNKKVQKQYASKDIDNAIDMVSVSHLAVPMLFSDGHVDIKYLSCISTKEDSDDVIIKEKRSIIKRLVKREGFTLLDGGKSVDDYVLTDEIIRGQRHMYRFRFVMTPSMHDRGLCGTDQNDSEGGIALLPVDYIVKTHDDLEFSKILLDKFGVSNPQLVYQGNVSIYQKKDDEYKDIIIAQVDELQPRPAGKVYHSYYCTLRL